MLHDPLPLPVAAVTAIETTEGETAAAMLSTFIPEPATSIRVRVLVQLPLVAD